MPLEKEKRKREKKTEKKANFGGAEFASYDVPQNNK